MTVGSTAVFAGRISRRKRRRIGPPLPPPRCSGRLLVRLLPTHVAMFRFLLEAYDNLAYFTVLNRHEALLKIVFSPHREQAIRAALEAIGGSVPLQVSSWPAGRD